MIIQHIYSFVINRHCILFALTKSFICRLGRFGPIVGWQSVGWSSRIQVGMMTSNFNNEDVGTKTGETFTEEWHFEGAHWASQDVVRSFEEWEGCPGLEALSNLFQISFGVEERKSWGTDKNLELRWWALVDLCWRLNSNWISIIPFMYQVLLGI